MMARMYVLKVDKRFLEARTGSVCVWEEKEPCFDCGRDRKAQPGEKAANCDRNLWQSCVHTMSANEALLDTVRPAVVVPRCRHVYWCCVRACHWDSNAGRQSVTGETVRLRHVVWH